MALALARARDVYGIRHLSFDRKASTLTVEFDATRLDAAAVAKLVRAAGLEIAPEAVCRFPPRGRRLLQRPWPERPLLRHRTNLDNLSMVL